MIASGAAMPAFANDQNARIDVRQARKDPLIKSALDDFYNLDYDKAIAIFERLEKAHPDDPLAVDHLLQAVVFRELYRLNLLDTTLYSHDGFLTGKAANGDPAVRSRVDHLTARAVSLCDARLKQNPNDVDALYLRGVARGLRSTYVALVDKSFLTALRGAVAARRDHERVLQIDPSYTDAKTIVGAHNYVVGSLPLPVKVLAGMAGLGGSKKKGLQYLEEAAKAGGESSSDARVALALFLRREGRYREASDLVATLVEQYPRNFLFSLEHCNLLKDGGEGREAIGCYTKLLDGAKTGQYNGAKVAFASFGLAESLRGQGNLEAALNQYEFTSSVPDGQLSLRQRASLGAGEMDDLLRRRDQAVREYEAVIAADNTSAQADIARKLLKEPYQAH
jgi:tetratricopeptide (TPR) repeat protein